MRLETFASDKKIGKVVIIGGVAGGASAAARLRRLSETTEIVLVERGPHVSFANCGLPYRVGGEIAETSKLLVQTPESLRDRLRIDVRINTEAVRIDREQRLVYLRDMKSGTESREAYDYLILSPGAAPVKPPIPGIERLGHFTVRHVTDVESILHWKESVNAQRAVVIGGGYIGLEMAEQLRHAGLSVTLVEALPQVMAPIDPDMAVLVHDELAQQQVDLYLGDGVSHFDAPEADARASTVVLRSGACLPADIVILGLGVRPEVRLAKDASLEIGNRGGIRVNERMQTTDPRIYAVGDAVEVRDGVTGDYGLVALAGPANRQGRVAADAIMGLPSRYVATFGTAVLRVFRLTVACTGASEKALRRANIPYRAVRLRPNNHAGYYPGAKPLVMKVLFSPEDGRLLGAQIVGESGVDKRIDVLATVLKMGGTVHDLADLELAYAPPYGSAKDPINLAGMIARNLMMGLVDEIATEELSEVMKLTGALLLDVRNHDEVARFGVIPGALPIPLPELRARIHELEPGRPYVVYCQSGQRSYLAARYLVQAGIPADSLSGGWFHWKLFQDTAK